MQLRLQSQQEELSRMQQEQAKLREELAGQKVQISLSISNNIIAFKKKRHVIQLDSVVLEQLYHKDRISPELSQAPDGLSDSESSIHIHAHVRIKNFHFVRPFFKHHCQNFTFKFSQHFGL